MVTNPPDISIIIPALNEAPNLTPLAEQVAAALSGRSYEMIIVDDNSKDDTQAVCAELAKTHPLHFIVREHPTNGLSGAVLHGMAQAQGKYLVCMDADLQHPPAKLPELLAPLERGEADFVLGSRYIPGGSTGEQWGVFRKVNSRLATLLARPFTGHVNDPMSGFFALTRETFERGKRLTPLGYKIGIELMAKCRVQCAREIPIHFAERTRGQSKLTLREQFRYLEHLSRLYDFHFPRLSPMIKFLIVTGLAWLIGFVIFMILLRSNFGSVGSTSVAYLGAIVVTAIFHARYVRTQREFLLREHPWIDFLVASTAEWTVCTLAAMYLVSRFDRPRVLELFFIPFGLAMFVRYVLRKEFLLDIRGLRRDARPEEMP